MPTLPSRDLHETVAFYERLGFRNAGDAPDVWDYLILRRGTIELHFHLDRDTDSLPTGSGCFVWVRDADELYTEWQRAGIDDGRLAEPVDTPYGVRTFALVDPSGNEIRLGTGPH